MRSGCPLIGQAVVRNAERRTFGAPDLLVRSDLLHRLFPDLIAEEDARIGALALGIPYHYRVVDVKFTTLSLLKDGHVSGSQAHYMAQVWLYNEALGLMQGFEPPAAYLLGRGWSNKRHPEKDWPELRWFDFLNRVVKPEPVVVRGAMAFGLKAVARAMRQHGCIQTEWTDGPADGLGAMVGAWSCAEEAAAAGVRLLDVPLMQDIGHYNEVDCRVMQELVSYLRANH
jgi:predicted RecB family nuclease